MIRIERDALYSRADLVELLKPLGIDADGFVSRVKPIKRLRQAWLGMDLLDAIRQAPALKEKADDRQPVDRPQAANGRPRRGRKPRFERLDGYITELKGGESG